MKTIGIIGGLGPEATVDYYNGIIDSFKNDSGDLNYPEIILYSVNMSVFIGLMKEKKYDRAAGLLIANIDSLKRAGADFAAISANTPHMLFDTISEKSALPLISIVEATSDECKRRGLKRAGLLGTGFTMKASFFPDVFVKHGMEIIMPDADDIELIDKKLFTEIELGIFRDDTRRLLVDIIGKMAREKSIDSVILGCTELPLILKEQSYAGIPALNTTRIHIDAIVKYAMQ